MVDIAGCHGGRDGVVVGPQRNGRMTGSGDDREV